MKEEAATDALLRQFLLGKVEDEVRQRIESLFITDSRTKERILAAEQELIDDYLEDRLSKTDKEAFLSLYSDTVAQRRKLRITKSIHEWAANQPNTMPVAHARETSVWDRIRVQLGLKPVLIIPIAMTAAVAIVIAVVWVNSRNERHRQYLAVQQEVARLNTPASLREVPSQVLLTLKPGSVRSLDPQPELKMRGDNSVAELRLLWMQKEDYPSYEAVVRLPGNDQPYSIPNLKAENEGEKVIRVRLPAHRLTRGTYQIELSGVATDGSKNSLEVYSFTVAE